MLFNSIAFIIFFPIVIFLYFLTPYKYRWILLLAASYYFYMCWKAEYIILILLSTIVDYFVSLKMASLPEKKQRRKWLYLSLLCNLGLLFTFKYFNFFSDSVNLFLQNFNIFYEPFYLNVLLPVGISFYTFQTLSYTIDVYNEKVEPERHFGYFALYVSFFPQLVAGPIERPAHLLPQFRQKFDFDYERVVTGLKMMAWGFFMKLVIADNAALVVDMVFNSPEKYKGLQIILATFFFSFQIFCDFAGYSIIAIGAAKVMGYDLMLNFRRPYFATSIREFWQRWHISLSTWFRDYVYIPLGGNRVVKWRWYYNLFVTFVVSGLWHGANWTFVIWGALHGFYLIFAIVTNTKQEKIYKALGLIKGNNIRYWIDVVSTFILVWFAWIFFRAKTVTDAFVLIKNLFIIKLNQFSIDIIPDKGAYIILVLFFIFCLQSIHFLEERLKQVNPLYHPSPYIRWATYITLILATLSFGRFSSSEFIYFRF